MTAPNISPFMAPTPHRPGTNDYDGCALTDHPAKPPIAGEMPTAAQQNTLGFTHVSLGAVVPVARISVTNTGAPSVAYVQSVNSNFVTGSITVTQNAAGDVSLTWTGGTFPAVSGQPTASLNLAVGIVAGHSYGISAVNITNGVRVTSTKDNVLTDMSFTVEVH